MPVTFMDLTDKSCRMPLWADDEMPDAHRSFYCGEKSVPGESWCKDCLERIKGVGTKKERMAESIPVGMLA